MLAGLLKAFGSLLDIWPEPKIQPLKPLKLNTTRDGVRYYSAKVPSQEERIASLNRRRKLLGTPEVISEPGAAIEVTRIPLTEEGKERLSIPFGGKSLPSPKGKE